mmetsp:Transcript_10281/g.24116  ORF Transcript_10281/g.24116 Transcript_10281/m.24116 type:complete len:538 (+) Transcript_10281:1121-2734(+)
MHQIAEGVRELGVVHQHQALLTEGDVLPEGGCVRQVEAEGIRRELVELLVRVDHVAEGLGHLLPLLVVDEAVRKDSLGEREVARHEHARPDHAVEPDDVLADEVARRRPELGVGAVGPIAAGDVVGERIEPHVHHVLLRRLQLGVLRDRDPPVERRTGHAEITQRFAELGQDLILAVRGLDEVRVLLDVSQQRFLVLGHAEEVALLRHLLQRLSARRVLVVTELRLVLRDKRLLAHVIPPLVGVEVDVALVGRAREQRLGAFLVLVGGGADVEVVGDPQPLVQHLEGGGVLVADIDGLEPHTLRRLGDLLPVLVGSCQEEHLAPVRPVPPRDDVRRDRLVRVAHVGVSVGVVDGGGDVVLLVSRVFWLRRVKQRLRRRPPQLRARVLARLRLINELEPIHERRVLGLLLLRQHTAGRERGEECGPDADVGERERREEESSALARAGVFQALEEGEGLCLLRSRLRLLVCQLGEPLQPSSLQRVLSCLEPLLDELAIDRMVRPDDQRRALLWCSFAVLLGEHEAANGVRPSHRAAICS